MSSRQGHSHGQGSSHRHRSREPQPPHNQDAEFPPLPPTRLPSLRYWASLRERDNTPPPASSARFQPARAWLSNGSRRAERLRNFDDRAAASAFGEREMRPSSTGNINSNGQARSNTTFDPGHPYQYHTPVIAQIPMPRSSASEMQDLDRTLHEANSHLRALLDYSYSPQSIMLRPTGSTQGQETSQPLPISPSLRPHEFGEDSRRGGKRRKLDAERYSTGFKGFRYGKYGQVEPGQLQMEIVSCDGGVYSNETSAENLLKDDSSVYCTQGNRCNLILRHQGGTVFTLSELIIKSPRAQKYTDP